MTNRKLPEINIMGEHSVLVQFEREISEEQLENILFFKNEIEIYYTEVKVEVINTFTSLLIYYHSPIDNIYRELPVINQLVSDTNIFKKPKVQLFYIPVCYDMEFGLDLKLISKRKGLAISKIIELHVQPVYTVYFIGFLPGFLYLGGLDSRLHFSRKIEPRMKVKKGAVGIGENQTGIYPKTSPGGWQIIGNSPVPLFDKNRFPPCEISPGSKVKFYSVSRSEFEGISEEVKANKYKFKQENYEW